VAVAGSGKQSRFAKKGRAVGIGPYGHGAVPPADGGAGEAEIARLSEAWDDLAERSGAPPFLYPGWISAWWRAFGKGRLEIVTVGSQGRLDSVLPVVRRGGAVFSPTNWHTPEFGLLGDVDGSLDELLGRLFAARASQVALGALSSRGSDIERLQAAAASCRYSTLVRTLERSPVVELDQDWEDYERGLSSKLRHDVARCRRRLGDRGHVSLDVRSDVEALDEALALEQLGWKGTAGTAIVSRAETAQFYAEIAAWAAQRGWLRLIFLRVDERAVAVHIALEHAGSFLGLKAGFDPALRSMSPGNVLIHASLQRAFAIGLKRFEFLGAADAYKLRWATASYDRLLLQAFSPRPAGRVLDAAFRHGRPAAKRVLATARRMRGRVRR
jgi:CelD/BcsL family acetyltransferase involved in cellulose biosynthesis